MVNISTSMFLTYPIFLFFHGFLIEPGLQEKLNGKVKSITETTSSSDKDGEQTKTIYKYDISGYLIEMEENPSTSLADKYSFEYTDGSLIKCKRIMNHVEIEDEIQYYEYKYDDKHTLISYRYYGLPGEEGLGFEQTNTIVYNDKFQTATSTNYFKIGSEEPFEFKTPAVAYFKDGRIIQEWAIGPSGDDTIHRYYTYDKKGLIISRTKTQYYDIYTCFDKNGRKLYSGPTNDSTKKYKYIYSNFDSKGNYRKMTRMEDSAVITREIEYY